MPRQTVRSLLWLVTMLVPAAGLAGTFHGVPCTKDCGGHKAGYEWARKKAVTSVGQCGGKSASFTEGCIVWVKEHQPSEDHSDNK